MRLDIEHINEGGKELADTITHEVAYLIGMYHGKQLYDFEKYG